jgi:hypothetical protein
MSASSKTVHIAISSRDNDMLVDMASAQAIGIGESGHARRSRS